MKHGLLTGARVVIVRGLKELHGVHTTDTGLVVGACTTIADLCRSSACPPWLGGACAQIAGPRVRELATVGGALLQERRCRYYNRPVLWRTASGACLRTGGDRCLAGGDRCCATQRSLLSTVLVAVSASVVISRGAEERSVLLEDLYGPEAGAWRAGGIIRSVSISRMAEAEGKVAVEWIRRRASIDYHDLVVAGASRAGSPHEVSVTVGAAVPYPRRIVLPSPAPGGAIRSAATLIPSAQSGRLSPAYLRHAAVVLAGRVIARVAP
jgi:CO/xanthine dehydrogenase FAD-binding subunit